jgi:hypothetical protein
LLLYCRVGLIDRFDLYFKHLCLWMGLTYVFLFVWLVMRSVRLLC